MPQQIRAVVVDPAAPGKLAVREVELRDPDRDEVAVKVGAISLNRGETRRALQVAEPGWRPGWDFAGVVETAAADGSGPRRGTRVVGITSGASAPEALVQRLVDFFRARGTGDVEELEVVQEDVRFMLPKAIRPPRASAAA